MNLEFAMTTGDPCPIAYIQCTAVPTDLGLTIADAFQRVAEELGRIGVDTAGSPFTRFQLVGDSDRIQFDAGFTLSSEMTSAGSLSLGCLPGGDAASAEFEGSFDDIWAARMALHEWVIGIGRVPIDGGWEVYAVSETSAQDAARCEIFVSVS